MSEATVRPATAEDAPTLRAIVTRTLLAAGFPAPSHDLDADLLDLTYYETDGCAIWAAERDGEIVGCAAVERGSDGDAVLRRLVGEALGPLAAMAVHYARDAGYRRIEAVAPPGFDGAEEALRTAGFEPAGTGRGLLYVRTLR
ncbi:MAG: hypothetical protein O2798_06950 [Chloroflexi bacterium]|nr:hypothetical protein [Chloroflexota bacterium]MDA1240564.1 hypothetical protein [Chloroflexota bacterium]MQC47845.1 hypothetical protein [Chloroflexota bacterium]